MTDPFGTDEMPGDLTDAAQVMSMDGTVMHIPDPGPPSPHMLWTGRTEDWPAVMTFLQRGNGPFWLESGDVLVISQDTDTPEEENLRVRPGEWLTWLGGQYGFEEGRVYPVFLRTGWEHPESLVGWIMEAADMPGLLRTMADNWLPDGYEVTIDTTSVREAMDVMVNHTECQGCHACTTEEDGK